jgi:O-methyltransferase
MGRRLASLTHAYRPMQHPTYSPQVADRIQSYHDHVRYSTMALAIQRLETDAIPGAFAEIGVYRGVTSAFIHRQAPERRFYLFDTFTGFAKGDAPGSDGRFRNTSQAQVAAQIGDTNNIEFRVGYFPETAAGLEEERFAFVMLDVDVYRPALSVLEFFYPRMSRGAYLFLHDFNSPESDRAISRAATEFMRDKPELLFEIPDFHGSAVFRKS